MTNIPRVLVTRAVLGICHMQVCVADDATDEEILETANRVNPSGTSNGWSRVLREPSNEAQRPGPCAVNAGRTHLLLVC